jgi:hypothetical protein
MFRTCVGARHCLHVGMYVCTFAQHGERFIREKLPRPFLAAHVRRGDFPDYARKDTTPSLEVAAGKLLTLSDQLSK